MLLPRSLIRIVEEVLFRLSAALLDRISDVAGEFWLQDNVVMQVFFQVLGAFAAAVPVEYAEDLEFGPLLSWDFRLLSLGLDYVQNDRDAILIHLANRAHIRIGRERAHRSKRLHRYFAVGESTQAPLQHLHVVLVLVHQHLSQRFLGRVLGRLFDYWCLFGPHNYLGHVAASMVLASS